MALTQKQRLFVDEYLIDLNGTQAAIRAGYSATTAQEQSSRLLSNVMVQAGIAAHCAPRVFGTVRAREAQPDLKSKWVRLPTGFGRQLKTEPSIPTTAHSPCCWQMLAPRLNFQPSMARGWISNLTHRPCATSRLLAVCLVTGNQPVAKCARPTLARCLQN